MSNTKNIMIVGVGGQGSLLASRIIGNAVLLQGYDVKVSEVHGMAQRGGSVVTYVKYGEKVYSPVICKGEADIILSFEQLEAARYVSYLKPDGIIITNTQQINPMPVVAGTAEYPQNLHNDIEVLGIKIISANALALATEAGNDKAVNVALIGLMSAFLGFENDIFMQAIKMSVPEKLLEVNLKAYELGRNYQYV